MSDSYFEQNLIPIFSIETLRLFSKAMCL